MRYLAMFVTMTVLTAGQTPPCAGLPPGKHSLLERFTASFGLTCDQQLKVEPLLHEEESVSKPLLRFTSLSAEEKSEIMLKVKLAARRQIRTLLTPDQQKLMDGEIEQTAKTGKAPGKKGGTKNDDAPKADALADEEALSQAVMHYAALTPEEKTSIVLQVKRAARADGTLNLAPEQQKKLDAEIQVLAK